MDCGISGFPGIYSDSCPLSHWCHPTISSSVVPFSCLLSFPASDSCQVSQFLASGGQSIGVSASVLQMNFQDWFPLGWTGWISLLSKSLLQHHSSKASNFLSFSLIQFSVEGRGCVPSLLFDLRPNYGGGNEDNGLLHKVPCTATLSALNLAACHNRPTPLPRLLDTHSQVCVSLLWGHCSFLLGPGMCRFCLCPPRVCLPSPV